MGRQNELVDIVAAEIWATDAAYKISETADKDVFVWVPKSQVEREPTGRTENGYKIYTYTMPTRLAQEKGLI